LSCSERLRQAGSKRVRIVRPSSLIEPGNRLVIPLRRTVVEPTPLAFGTAIFVRYTSDFCLLAAAARNGESGRVEDGRGSLGPMANAPPWPPPDSDVEAATLAE
jgi:hypothetical protein